MKVRDEFYVSLKGKRYPLYAGVLIAAMENGLRCLETQIYQAPTEENGQMAIVIATATFDGPEGRDRVYTDVGDASPRNTSPQIATAALRMASTRAKGRALRDGIGLGETLKEELPDGPDADDTPARPLARNEGKPDTYRQERAQRTTDSPGDAAASGYVTEGIRCEDCGAEVPANVAAAAEKRFGRVLCVADGKARAAVEKNAAAPAET